MKRLFNLICSVLLISGFISCAENEEITNNDDFDIPELTTSNTIQFTVDTRSGYGIELHFSGSQIAIDWGDGKTSKEVDPRTGYYIDLHRFGHTYKSPGKYRVKIWTEKLTKIRLSGLLRDFSDLHVGNCPVLTDAVFNSLAGGKSINLNGCKQLEVLELSNWEQLESATLNECAALKELRIYSSPAVKPLDLSQNSGLRSIDCGSSALDIQRLPKNIISLACYGNGLENITLENFKALTTLDCSHNNKLTSLNITGCDKLSTLNFSNTKVGSFDFSKCPELATISCAGSELTAVNVDQNKKLTNLYCLDLNLTSLDISKNTNLSKLDCSNNKLTSLDVSANKYMSQLYINDNLLNKDELEIIFKALPSYEQLPQSSWPMLINISGNAGAATCDVTIAGSKGWVVR